jgi:predicted patatin/cPLA2 family phospholipase
MAARPARRQASGMTLLAADPRSLLRDPADVASPVLRLLLERRRAGGRPGRHGDGNVVCLAIEGGGMRGAVTAGMCVALESAGLVDAFDRVYGVSAGALNGAAVACGQAALSATHYRDAATRRVINPARALRRRPVIDSDFLWENLIAARKPLAFARLAAGPEFRALATSVDTQSLRVLADFRDGGELMQGVRASASLPAIAGEPPEFRGERMLDGGLIEPIPFRSAFREGATHVLVLRSRPIGYRKSRHSELAERLVLRDPPEIAQLLRHRAGEYNRLVAELDALQGAQLLQVAVPPGTHLIGRLEASPAGVVEAVREGAAAMARMILDDAIDLCWQPVAYRRALSSLAA